MVGMLTRILIVSAVVLTIAAALAAPKLKNTQTEAVLQQPVHEPQRVEVQQQIVRPVVVLEARRLPRPAARPRAAARIAGTKPQPVTFIAKAARTLVGDGRHRPEPFPRAR